MSTHSALHDIASLTEARAETLSFNETDSERILANLIGEGNFLVEEEQRPTTKQLEYIRKKEINYHLHAVTLAEYFRAKRIPRGLRILLKPTLCRDNPDFITKWRCILNKCSLDLVLLTVEELQKELTKIHTEAEELTNRLKSTLTNDEIKTMLGDLENTLKIHKNEIEKVKVKKFKRDTYDYANDCVYTWFSRFDSNSRQRLYKRQTGEVATSDSSTENLSVDEIELGEGPSTSGSTVPRARVPFLGRGRGRGRPGGAGENIRNPRPFTRSQIHR